MTHLEFRRYVTVALIKSRDEALNKKATVQAQMRLEIRTDLSAEHIVGETALGPCCVCRKT